MGDNVRTVEEEHRLNEVVDKRRDEHWLQLDVRILEDVGEGALRAVVRQNDDAVGLDARTDETENDLKIKRKPCRKQWKKVQVSAFLFCVADDCPCLPVNQMYNNAKRWPNLCFVRLLDDERLTC